MISIRNIYFLASILPIFLLAEDVPVIQQVLIDYSTSSMCPFDCKPEHCKPVTCPSGQPSQWDGCRCCKTCPRGQGDMCDFQHPCSDKLNCIFVDGTANRGICRSNITCRLASGKVLQDGETFQPHCSMQCSCQGGLVGCASLCQNDERTMAFAMKGTCQRVKVANSCCPQIVCDSSSNNVLSNIFFRKSLFEPDIRLQEASSTKSTLQKPENVIQRDDEKMGVEYAAPQIILQPTQQPARLLTKASFSKMRSFENAATLEPLNKLSASKLQTPPSNCSGTPIALKSCALNKCGLRLTDDFVPVDNTCPANLIPSSTYCMFRPCTKKSRQHPCKLGAESLSEIEIKVKHRGCSPRPVTVKYCRSCKSTANRCCYPTRHRIEAFNQTCFDGSTRTFYVAQATECACRTDVFRQIDCQASYQKWLDRELPQVPQVIQAA